MLPGIPCAGSPLLEHGHHRRENKVPEFSEQGMMQARFDQSGSVNYKGIYCALDSFEESLHQVNIQYEVPAVACERLEGLLSACSLENSAAFALPHPLGQRNK